MRTLALLSILFVLAALPASARAQIIVEPPCCSNSTIPTCLSFLGHDAAGVPDPLSIATVIVRDLANNPVPGALVVLDLSECPDLRLCADPHDPDLTVDCARRTIRRQADAAGVAQFRLMGWSIATPGTPGSPYHSALVFADGVLLGRPNVSIYDLDRNGMGGGDLAAWLTDFFSATNPARGDYDCTGSLGGSDVSTWLAAYFANGSTANCSPEGPCP